MTSSGDPGGELPVGLGTWIARAKTTGFNTKYNVIHHSPEPIKSLDFMIKNFTTFFLDVSLVVNEITLGRKV